MPLVSLIHDSAPVLRSPQVIVLCVCFVALGAVNRAEASCGDWLGHDEAVYVTGALAAADRATGERPAVPCDGPTCRQSRDELPGVPVAPAPTFDSAERWCRLPDDPVPMAPPNALLPPEARLSLPDGHRPGVERPPCACG